MGSVDFRAVSEALARLAATLHGPYSLTEVVAQLSKDIAALVDVDGAGVMVVDDQGALRFVSSSDELLARLESLQIEYDEGPCLLAYHKGEEVIVDDLGDDPRFPRFSPHALEAGLRAVYSFPMEVAGSVVGATNLYAREPRPLDADQVRVARMLTDAASSYVLHADDSERSRRLNEQLQTALDSRVVIEQAKGLLAGTAGISVDDAFAALRSHARSRNRKLRDVAHELLAGELAASRLLSDSPPSRKPGGSAR